MVHSSRMYNTLGNETRKFANYEKIYNTLQQFWEKVDYRRPVKEPTAHNTSELKHSEGAFCYKCGSYCSQTYS